jgi:hypothetical protein
MNRNSACPVAAASAANDGVGAASRASSSPRLAVSIISAVASPISPMNSAPVQTACATCPSRTPRRHSAHVAPRNSSDPSGAGIGSTCASTSPHSADSAPTRHSVSSRYGSTAISAAERPSARLICAINPAPLGHTAYSRATRRASS